VIAQYDRGPWGNGTRYNEHLHRAGTVNDVGAKLIDDLLETFSIETLGAVYHDRTIRVLGVAVDVKVFTHDNSGLVAVGVQVLGNGSKSACRVPEYQDLH
jgi:hypothetical protein